jgi:hypothetical protein
LRRKGPSPTGRIHLHTGRRVLDADFDACRNGKVSRTCEVAAVEVRAERRSAAALAVADRNALRSGPPRVPFE